LQQAQHLEREFVRHAVVIGGQPPARPEVLPFVKAQGDIGVADIDAQQ
jgi:hypothetical protein